MILNPEKCKWGLSLKGTDFLVNITVLLSADKKSDVGVMKVI